MYDASDCAAEEPLLTTDSGDETACFSRHRPVRVVSSRCCRPNVLRCDAVAVTVAAGRVDGATCWAAASSESADALTADSACSLDWSSSLLA